MSQDSENHDEIMKGLRESIQKSISGEGQAVANLQKSMAEGFSQIFELLSYIAKAEAINQSILTLLTDNQASIKIRPSNIRPGATSTPRSAEILCHECGKTFVRRSTTDSISKHAKETTCRPFQCQVCKKLFKRVSQLNDHTRNTIRCQFKRPAAETLVNEEEPEAKRARTSLQVMGASITNIDTEKTPLKEQAASNIPATSVESDTSNESDDSDYFLNML